jgi:hypothetical protein
MTKNETEVLRLSRRLTPEHRAELLDRVRSACREEQAAGGGPFCGGESINGNNRSLNGWTESPDIFGTARGQNSVETF